MTERFNFNVLTRINNELGGKFELERFEHYAFYNASIGRVEMHLRALADHDVSVAACNRSFSFRAGETIHTENSYKYTLATIDQLASGSGFRVQEIFTDEKDWFALALFAPAES